METKLKYVGLAIVLFFTLGLAQYAAARDLIVVASKATQKASQDWLGFLELKEIPVKLITPDAFSEYKEELYIVVLGSLDESKEIAAIAEDALTADELKAVSSKSDGQMYYKPQAWNVGQKVILFLGPNQEAVIKARKSTKDEWYEKLQEWFDIDDSEGFHVY